MLSNKRIEEATGNVDSYLAERLITKEPFRQIVYDTYMRNHRESLQVAERLFTDNASSLWVIVVSYYSMFYIANAVLYKLGYKIGSRIAHKVTADALIVFVRDRIRDKLLESYEYARDEAMAISDNLIQSFDSERVKRSRFQYETTDSIEQNQARISFERAKEFSKEMERLLL